MRSPMLVCMREQSTYELRETVGRRIRETREAQGLSLRKLGLMIGMDYKHLFRIEHGQASPTLDALARIAAGLDVRVHDLLDD